MSLGSPCCGLRTKPGVTPTLFAIGRLCVLLRLDTEPTREALREPPFLICPPAGLVYKHFAIERKGYASKTDKNAEKPFGDSRKWLNFRTFPLVSICLRCFFYRNPHFLAHYQIVKELLTRTMFPGIRPPSNADLHTHRLARTGKLGVFSGIRGFPHDHSQSSALGMSGRPGGRFVSGLARDGLRFTAQPTTPGAVPPAVPVGQAVQCRHAIS